MKELVSSLEGRGEGDGSFGDENQELKKKWGWEIVGCRELYTARKKNTYRRNSSGGAVLSGAEQKIGVSEMLIDLVGDGHLRMRKRLESLLVRFGHLRLDIVEEQSEGFAAKLRHLVQLPLQRRYLLRK